MPSVFCVANICVFVHAHQHASTSHALSDNAAYVYVCMYVYACMYVFVCRFECAAALGDQARLINSMASRGANINAPDVHGKTPLHYAIAAGSAKERMGDSEGMARSCVTVKVLLRQGANLMVKDGHGKYPLALASTQMSGVIEDEVYEIETGSDDTQCDLY